MQWLHPKIAEREMLSAASATGNSTRRTQAKRHTAFSERCRMTHNLPLRSIDRLCLQKRMGESVQPLARTP